MAHKLIDRCKETTSSTGTGNLTLTGAVSGYVGAMDATYGLTADGDTGWFCAEAGSQWEVFLGTRVSATVLARTTVISSSNSGAAVNFSSPPVVFSTVPGAKISTVGPAFSAYRSTSNQSLTTGTPTKVLLNAEEFDTSGCFDSTTNYRFTPTVPGYYRFEFAVGLPGTTITSAWAGVYKNGTEAKRGLQANLSSGNASYIQSTGNALIYLNGTTDYVELWALAIATTPAVLFGSPYTFLSGSFATG